MERIMTDTGHAITLLEGITGSRAYGLDTPDSDTDIRGVFAWPTADILALHPPADAIERKDPDDYAAWEARKFLKLVLAGNPNITELLWLDTYTVRNPWGQALIGIRQHLSAAPRIRRTYLGFATGELRQLEKDTGGPNRAKRARHVLRLLRQGFDFYSTGHLTVRIPVHQRDEIFNFGDTVAAGNLDTAKAMMHFYESAFDNRPSALPAEPDTGIAAAWLAAVRDDYYQR